MFLKLIVEEDIEALVQVYIMAAFFLRRLRIFESLDYIIRS